MANVLMVGDSSGSFSGDLLAIHCSGANVTNACVAGSKASEWAQEQYFSNAVTEAIRTASSSSPITHVWIGLGGNDVMDSCFSMTDSLEPVKQNIVTLLGKLRSVLPSNVVLFATGYAQPTPAYADQYQHCGYTPQHTKRLNDMWKEIAASHSVRFVDGIGAGQGSYTQWSDPAFFVDSIHMNERGYEKLWSKPELQTLLGCSAQPRASSSPSSSPSSGGGVFSSLFSSLFSSPYAAAAALLFLAAGIAAMRTGKKEDTTKLDTSG